MAEVETASQSALGRVGATRTAPASTIIGTCAKFAHRKPLSAAGAIVLLTLIGLVAIGPVFDTRNPNVGSLLDRLVPPSPAHPFGTDEQGRDLFTRALYGGRLSLTVGVGATFFGVLAGTIIGLMTGYLGGKFDLIVQRFIDALMALPGIVILMTLAVVLGPSPRNTILAIAVLGAPSASRIVRSAVMSVRVNPYIEAARALGASPLRVMLRHVLPNAMAPVLIIASVGVGGAILAEAGLGFLGLSVPPPFATWGTMLSNGAQNQMETAPWLALVPGIAIGLTVFSVNLLADGLRDVLDPRLRGTGK